MFTGLVEALGLVERVVDEGDGKRIRIVYPKLAEPLALGESIAVNGCCLTVVVSEGEQFEVQAGHETLSRTNLGDVKPGGAVNLERALRASDRLGGHFVQGHIDTTATLVEKHTGWDWPYLRFRVDPPWTMLMVEKGSIAIDGVSLTLVTVGRDDFKVMLIPHTLEVTTLGRLQEGDRVNIETDLLAKHIRRLMGATEASRWKPEIPKSRTTGPNEV